MSSTGTYSAVAQDPPKGEGVVANTDVALSVEKPEEVNSGGAYHVRDLDAQLRKVSGGDDAPVTLGWNDMSFTANKREIVLPTSGSIRDRDLCAIMGPSGAGKTSFMNILAGRVRSGGALNVGGSITANGQKVDMGSFRKNIAYVMQEDALFASQTPREALRFSAALRLPTGSHSEAHAKLVEAIIGALGLGKCSNTMIGSIMIKGISGGEKKRTAIGVELVSNPRILFLDEPTSGLDSFSALQVIKVLKDLSSTGRTIITTIHQPSSEVFELFDSVLLLAAGRVIYHDRVVDLPRYFASHGHVCPGNYNPADFVMSLLQQLPDNEQVALADARVAVYNSSDAKQRADGLTGGMKDSTVARPGCCTQFKHLLVRDSLNVVRDKVSLISRIVTTLGLNLVLGLVFMGAASWSGVSNEPADLAMMANNQFGALVQISISSLFGLAQSTLLSFPTERPVFLREYAVTTYGAIPYVLSKLLIEIPMMWLQACLVFLMTYWTIGLNGNFFVLTSLIALLGLVGSSTTLVIGALSSDVRVAFQLQPLLFVPQILFSGFFVPISHIPEWLRWAQYLCSLKYTINLLMIEEFKGVPSTLEVPVSSYDTVVYGCSGANLTADYSCTTEGPGYSTALFPNANVEVSLLPMYLGILIAIFVVFRVIALVALVIKSRG